MKSSIRGFCYYCSAFLNSVYFGLQAFSFSSIQFVSYRLLAGHFHIFFLSFMVGVMGEMHVFRCLEKFKFACFWVLGFFFLGKAFYPGFKVMSVSSTKQLLE